MTWAKIDDQFYMNPKTSRMDRDEQDLYLAALVYCNAKRTEGFIPGGMLLMLCAWAKIPEANEAKGKAIASRLVELCFLHVVDGGFEVHDFLDWNKTNEEMEAVKIARSNAGRLGGVHSGESRRANAKQTKQKRSKPGSNTPSKSEAKTNPVPVPVNPDLKEQKERAASRSRDPNLDDPAVVIYRDMAHLTPNGVQREDIVACVKNLECWSRIVREWMSAGWKPGNVAGMLERYKAAAGSNGVEPEKRKKPDKIRLSTGELLEGDQV